MAVLIYAEIPQPTPSSQRDNELHFLLSPFSAPCRPVGLLRLQTAVVVGQLVTQLTLLCRLLYVPKEVTVDAANSPHLADFCAQTDDLDAHVCSLLDDDIGIVGKLRRGSAGIVLNFVGHQLG